ncbi:MAG: CBS domain-containing protein [Saccharospirillum sp.]|uniref:CBS domain-containing protein n=1 Tax=Saccharospirillum sp. TaxID=2033801 RepID=UPI00329913BB
MRSLALYNTESIDRLVWPEEQSSITGRTPALSILTDFRQHQPHVIDAGVKALELENLMKRSHVKMKLVLDKDQRFIGIVSLYDLSEENILKKVSKHTARDELLATDFMHRRASLKCFDYHELARATIEDVLETQKHNHQQHCLVIDRLTHEIRGLISARDVARLINRSVDIERHISFETLFEELAAR